MRTRSIDTSSNSSSSIRCCRNLLLLVVILLLSLLDGPTLCSAEVVHLTDNTFEHQTQATTGSTTGSWLVLFGIPTCDTCHTVQPYLDELSTDGDLYEKGIVIGSVDCNESTVVCSRFGIEKVPSLLYIHKGLLYHVPQELYNEQAEPIPAGEGDKEVDEEVEEGGVVPIQSQSMKIFDTLKSFVLKDFSAISDAKAIPRPQSWLDANIIEPFEKVYGAAQENTLLAIAILLMSTMLLLTFIVLIVVLVSVKNNTTSTTSTTTKTTGGGKRKKKD